MSIGELLNLYRDNELDIHPEFQRFFRWTLSQKSRLIESLLLGIPLPSIFVSQRRDGVWDVIDGVQRLSTIFQFIGVLRNETGDLVPPLVLSATKYLPSLEGRVWEDEEHPERDLGRDHQLIVKRSKIDVKIVLRESDEQSKYELFQRLNTGGSPLSDQELRNCIIITINGDFYRWINELAHYQPFQDCISVSERLRDEQYDLELVTRFLVLRNKPDEELRQVGEIGDYLTDRIVEMAQDEAYQREVEERAFKATFDYLARCLGDDSFRRYDAQRQKFRGPFLISAFEFIALGIGRHYQDFGEGRDPEVVAGIVKTAWADPALTNHIGSGVRASSRIPYTIPLGRARFAA
ncbi:MAG: DUF262 domain-containing protein [Chloroflexi bacterium]|nr:DUF262 domain-containing protein [Chloroflexota bacterium]